MRESILASKPYMASQGNFWKKMSHFWKSLSHLDFLRCDRNNFGTYGKVMLRAFQDAKKIKKRLIYWWEIMDWVGDIVQKRGKSPCIHDFSLTFCLFYCTKPFAKLLRFTIGHDNFKSLDAIEDFSAMRKSFFTREDPRSSCARSSQAGNYWGRISPSAKLAFEYGAFGAKDRLLSSRFFPHFFPKKKILFGVPESKLEFG